MPAIVNVALALVVGALVLLALYAGFVVHHATRLAFRQQKITRLARDEVPEEWRGRLGTATAFMQGLGFVYRYSVAAPPILTAQGDAPTYSDVYEHEDGLTHAHVVFANPPNPRRPCNISYYSLLEGGRQLVTTNGTNSLVRRQEMDHQDRYFPTLRQAWQFHRQRLAQVEGRVIRDPEAFLRLNEQLSEDTLPAMQRAGLVVQKGPAWFLTWPGAFRVLLRERIDQHRLAKMNAAAGEPELVPLTESAPGANRAVDAPEVGRAAFDQYLAAERRATRTRAAKWKIFALSAIAFVAIGSLWFSWTFLPILLGVIALHEAGHFLAMRLSGYTNLSVFFIPLLGGAATGEKPDAGPWEKLFVDLAGPVPGMALAVAGMVGMLAGAFQPPSWFAEFLWACLIINYLNLLPLAPLDGGRVVETFLFASLPRARFAFALLGLAVLAGFGLYTGDKVVLLLAVLVCFTLPFQWRMALVDSAIARTSEEVLDESRAVQRIVHALEQPRFQGWSFEDRAAALSALLPQLQGRRARWWEAAGGMAIYLACLGAPLALAHDTYLPRLRGTLALAVHGIHLVPDNVEREPAASEPQQQRDWLAEADRLASVPDAERLKVLLNAAEDAAVSREDARRARYLEAALAIAAHRPPRDPERIHTFIQVASDELDASERRRRLRAVIAELDGASDRASLLLLAESKTRLSSTEGVAGGERTMLLREALAHRQQGGEAWHQLVVARTSLAIALYEDRQPAETEALLRENVRAIPLAGLDDRTREGLFRRVQRLDAETSLAWFLIAGGRSEEAAMMLDVALRAVPARITVSWEGPHMQASQARLWARLHLPPGEPLREAWAHYEGTRRRLPRMDKPFLLHELDRLVVARSLRDADLEMRARAQIREALTAETAHHLQREVCSLARDRQWRDVQWRARREAAGMAGACGPRS